MVDVRVNSAVGDEAQEMDVRLSLTRACERVHERRVLEELAGRDGVVDPHEVLEDDAAGADREVADLGVAHLAGRQPDGLTRRVQGRVRKALPELVEDGRLRQLDGVPGAGRSAPPAVEDDERYERIRAAASQMAVNDSTSRDAPPTRAPSTSRSPNRGSTLSGLAEP